MNSFLGGLGNALLNTQKVSKPQQASMPNILMQAIGAAMRGESPQAFLQNLAQTHPQLRQYDLSNLQQTAQQVCQQNGVDIQAATQQIDGIVSSVTQSNH